MNQDRRKPVVLLVGKLDIGEVEALSAPLVDTAEWSFALPKDAVDALQRAQTMPDVVVLAQERPGEIADALVQELQAIAPLSGMIAVLGSWCEGETRTGRPWPGVMRCEWHTWPLRWQEEWQRWSAGTLPLWTMPATLSDEERLLLRMSDGVAEPSAEIPRGCVAIVGETKESANMLADAVACAGYSVVAGRDLTALEMRGTEIVIWEATSLVASDAEKVTRMKARFRNIPILALVPMLRRHDALAMQSAGIDGVMAKPFSLIDLHAEIARLTKQGRVSAKQPVGMVS